MALGFATRAGPYVFMVFDENSGNIPLLIIALGQVLAVSYLYGLKRYGTVSPLYIPTFDKTTKLVITIL